MSKKKNSKNNSVLKGSKNRSPQLTESQNYSQQGQQQQIINEDKDPLALMRELNKPLPFSNELHEKLIMQYLQHTSLDSVLLFAIKQLISGDTIPKNPYYKLSRSLTLQNSQRELFLSYEEALKKFRKNQVDGTNSDYGIEELEGSIFGIPKVLEFVDIEKFKALKKAILDIIPDFNETFLDCKFKISHSIGGGYLFKSDLLPYQDSAARPLEIAQEIFVAAESTRQAMQAFSYFVYEDIKSITNINDMHLFKKFVFLK